MHAEARIQEQVVYLGDDSRNQQLGKREREMQEGRQPIKGINGQIKKGRLEMKTMLNSRI